jgi:uncharacterized protein YecT (DUF1311 family)
MRMNGLDSASRAAPRCEIRSALEVVRSIAVILAVVALGWPDLSGPRASSEAVCEDASTSAEMRACANRRFERADAELNRVYRDLASRLPTQRRAQLKAAQEAWITFRDRNTAFVAGAAEGGTLYPILEVSELAKMTEERTEALKAHLHQDVE